MIITKLLSKFMKKVRKLLQLIFKKLIQIYFKIIYGKIIYNKKKNIGIVKKISKDNYFSKKKYHTYQIKNGRIYTDYVENVAIINNNYLFGKTSFQQVNGRLLTPNFNSVLKKGTPRVKKKIKGLVLNLAQGASSVNYFHWLFDMLPKIFICSKNYEIKKIDYFYLCEPQKFQIQLLNFFKIKKNKIINSKLYRHIQANQIITVEHPWYNKGYFFKEFNNFPKWIITWLRNNFLKKRKKFYASKKIFIDRSDSKNNHAQIINKNEVINFLKKQDFKVYKIAKMDFFKQVYLFWNADFIISAHGAALANLAFCKPKTKIIEIKPESQPGNYFKKISKINNLNYICMGTNALNNNCNGDIIISLKQIEIFIKMLDNKAN
jgi:capsular polysaccharide biosynthesis protein